MALILKPAQHVLKPIKVLAYGPTYSGKTLSLLYIAAGIVMSKRKCTEKEAWKHVVLIDTEIGRGALHNKIGPYNYLRIDPPYQTEKLVSMLNELNLMDNVDVIITDSLTHFWTKDGGILDQKAAKDKQGGNSYTNWQEYTGKFNEMIDAILSSPKHILTTARAKSDTALETNEKGKSVPRTYGLKPELRDGIEFEFDIVFNVDKLSHDLIVDKGIPGLPPVFPMATPATGIEIFDYFNADAVIPEVTEADVIERIKKIIITNKRIPFVQLKLSGRKLDELTMDQLLVLETELKEDILKGQVKNPSTK